MKKIGFITSQEEGLNADDQLSLSHLENHSILAVPVIWDHSKNQNLESYDGLIFRSCWNYHQKYSEFLNWVNHLKKLSIPIFNPLSVIEWNLDKKYLLNWDSAPKTKQFQKGQEFSKKVFDEILMSWSSQSAVIKPNVSLNGQDTFLINQNNFEQKYSELLLLFKSRNMLIQEFIPEIRSSGETSAVFFNKKFSHAVGKIPAINEFRIHREYGGKRNPVKISSKALSYAEKILERIPDQLLYARVDFIERESDFVLIEIELTDPMLYLHTDPHSAKQFAEAVAEVLY